MDDNLKIWAELEMTDPKFVKSITGKAYRGNSPHPTWRVKQLTRGFGPAGHGFGWEIISDQYIDSKPHVIKTGPETSTIIFEKMHECRIRFWTRDPETKEVGHFEGYGCTKALYLTNAGKWMDDEDAAKKSLTDAITKCISQIGGAADIFLGRWDDNKYVAQVREAFKDQTITPDVPAQLEPNAVDVGF